eukprot:TRINITY_DN2318_c0_g1_i1.p1 TRINITY_DN2318_c0_g1~~TRINITY_DN2318_c0_g1_i1.p1  ORF type:complete len:548 (+),score=159.72 TRINITY_DN2318_c0_g1_i1:58-1644(+)
MVRVLELCSIIVAGVCLSFLHIAVKTKAQPPQATSRNEVAKAAGMEPGMLPAEFHYAENNAGRWMWAGGSANRTSHDIMVVMSSSSPDLTRQLLSQGYTVWKASIGQSFNTHAFKIDQRNMRQFGPHLTTVLKFCMDPFRPEAKITVFITGDGNNHINRIEAAASAARETGGTAPLNDPFAIGSSSPQHKKIVKILSLKYPELKIDASAALTGYKNLEFALPLHVLQSHPAKYYSRVYSFPVLRVVGPLFFEASVPSIFNSTKQVEQPLRKMNDVKWKGIVKSNAMGTWTYDPEGSNLDTIVVVGGQNVDPTEVLVRAGYVVWMRNDDCRGLLKKATKATRDSIYAACREMWGYLGYLSDSDPAKPVGKQVAFVHGHLQSWHQPGDLGKIISDAVSCSNKVDGYVPLTKVRTANINRKWEESGMAEKWIAHWNKQYGDIYTVKGKRLESFCCASAVVPQSVIEKRPVSEYARFADPSTFVLQSGFFWEYMFPMVFGQPEVVDTSKTLASCPYTYSNSFGPYIPGVGLR